MSDFVTYVLKSQVDGRLYVGITGNIMNRLRLHNSGKVKSTKGYRPWLLLETRTCATRREAMVMERLLKTSQQKELLKHKYK